MTELSRDRNDQCVLTALIDHLSPGFFPGPSGRPAGVGPIGNAPVTYLGGDAETVVSKLFNPSSKSVKSFLEITPAEQALMLPKIQLLKMVYSDSEPKKFIKQVPIVFRDHIDQTELQRVFSRGKGRLGNVGIQNISLEQIGKTGAITTLFQVHLSIFAESIEAFLTGAPDGSAPYTDLITFSGVKSKKKKKEMIKDLNTGEKESKNKIADPTYFEIKAVIGWNVPKDKTRLINKDLRQALQYTEMVMKLNLVSHNITFNQDGTVKIDLEYKSKIETLLDSFRGDIFHSPILKKDKKAAPTTEPRKASKKPGEDPPKKKAAAEAEKAAEISKKQILKLFDLFEDEIKFVTPRNLKGYFEDMAAGQSLEAVRNLLEGKDTLNQEIPAEAPNIKNKLESQATERAISKEKATKGASADKQDEGRTPPPLNQQKPIPYIYLGYLIEAATALAQDPAKAPSSVYKYRVLVGPLTYISRTTRERININLGQVPVSLANFSKFINDTIVKKGVSRMSLMSFLKSMISTMVLRSLGSGCTTPGTDLLAGQAMKSKVDMTIISHNTKKGEDVFKKYEKKGNYIHVSQLGNKFNKKARLKTRQSEKDQDPLFDYLVIYASYMPTPHRSGNKKIDEKDGIFHYFLGRDRGIVNSINFQKVDMPARRTYLMKKEATPTDYLIERYNADIEMTGNPFITVAQLIHINPSIASLGDSRSQNSYGTRLGLTGYYFITRLTHQIGVDNKFITKIHAVGQGSLNTSKKKPINKVAKSGKKAADLGAKKASEGPDKGKGEQSTPVDYGKSAIGAASDAYAITDSAAYGSSSTLTRPSGGTDLSDITVSDREDLFDNRVKPNSAFVSSVNESTLRIKESCKNHDYAQEMAEVALRYLTAIHPTPHGNAPDSTYRIEDDLYRISGTDLQFFGSPFSAHYDSRVRDEPTVAYLQVRFRQSKMEGYTTVADVADSRGNVEHEGCWGSTSFEDCKGESWEELVRRQQRVWKTVSYSFNFYKHMELGWFMYNFVENIVPASTYHDYDEDLEEL
jgi:hypothetical protein